MRTQKFKHKRVLTICLITLSVVGAMYAYTLITKFNHTHYHSTSSKVSKLVKENSACGIVEEDNSYYGLQWGQEGVSNERIEFILKDCELITIKEEAKRLLAIMKTEVTDLDKIDIIKLTFISEENSESILIKNGILN